MPVGPTGMPLHSLAPILLSIVDLSGQSLVWSPTIPPDFSHLSIRVLSRGTQAAAETMFSLYYNDDTLATNYRRAGAQWYTGSSDLISANDGGIAWSCAANAPANAMAVAKIDIDWYANPNVNKVARCLTSHLNPSTTFLVEQYISNNWYNTAPITKVGLFLASGTWISGSFFRLEGLP